jgi:hypothetical protein
VKLREEEIVFVKHPDSSEEESLIMAPVTRRPVPKPFQLLPLVGFDAALAEAKRQGNFTLTCPVICVEGSEPRCEPLLLKTLKELQSAVKRLGPTVPYTLQVLDAVASQWLTPYDWHQIAKATLAPRDFILWRREYEERARKLVQERSSSRNGTKPTVPMLLGQKDYAKPAAQLKISKAVLEKINQIAVSSWQSLPPPGAISTVFSGIRQKHDESYESYVARLEEAVSRILPPLEGTDMLIKQLAWEYVNTLCQDLNRPIHKTSSLQDYIKACVDASLAVIQGIAHAATRKGKKFGATYGITCFSYKKPGHLKKDCKNLSGDKKSIPLVPSQRCDKHRRSKCKLKSHKDGTPLTREAGKKKEL